ncbi:hypothetical protein [Candidatus Halobonum tyrrellensis]|uniref:hypothetical protein n=1 Tax=Candidatus Halobonum tyrrellensis TaxID=1431545 RepID=UPI00190F7074|nr:hypothetical protein [Candidatus Halobonum tyrrellensis]
MLVPNFFVCEACGTVHAAPERPPACGDCGADALRPLSRGSDADAGAYFSASLRES